MLWVKAGFHNFGTSDLLCQIILLHCGIFARIPGLCTLDASSNYPPGITSKNVSRHFQMLVEGPNHTRLRITGVGVNVTKNKRQQNFLFISIPDS